MSDLSRIRIEIGERAIFTRVFIDDTEVKGVTRVWFDSGDVDSADRPRKAWREYTRVHLEIEPAALEVTGDTTIDRVLAMRVG